MVLVFLNINARPLEDGAVGKLGSTVNVPPKIAVMGPSGRIITIASGVVSGAPASGEPPTLPPAPTSGLTFPPVPPVAQ